jgi:hypothetical protein
MTRLTSLWLLGVAVFLAIAIVFGNQLGIPFPIAIRIVAANGCLAIMYQIGSKYPGEKWPLVALAIGALFNFAVFFSPLADLPAKKADILFFAIPDALIFLLAWLWTHPVTTRN